MAINKWMLRGNPPDPESCNWRSHAERGSERQKVKLTPEATVKEYLTVRREGLRDVKRLLDDFNLEMIISVGYTGPDAPVWEREDIYSEGALPEKPVLKKSFTTAADGKNIKLSENRL